MVEVFTQNFLKQTIQPMNGTFSAYKGFQTMGAHPVIIDNLSDDIPNILNKENISIGGIGWVHDRLDLLNIQRPLILDYPIQLRDYLKRDLWEDTLSTVYKNLNKPIFVKPKDNQKLFTGKIISDKSDFSNIVRSEDYPVWCSQPIQILSEWRCYVRYGRLLKPCFYKGDFRIHPDFNIIQNAISLYKDSPKAYAIDWGVTERGETVLIEVNDAFAIGDYGLDYLSMAKLLYTRWSEMVDCKDWFNFENL
jgi:hypothetical protein